MTAASTGRKGFGKSQKIPKLNIPNHIKLAGSKEIFCKVIKTHLFKLAYL